MKKEKIYVGLDISTTTTAVCALNESGELLKLKHQPLNKIKKGKPVYPDFWSKVDQMEEFFNEFFEEDWEVKEIAVEEYAKAFMPGKSSAGTLFTLASFNKVLGYILYKRFGLKPYSINVRSGRKTVGIKIDYKDKSKTTKQKVLEQVVNRHPKFPWVYRETKGEKHLTKINEDLADSWVIAKAAWINLKTTLSLS